MRFVGMLLALSFSFSFAHGADKKVDELEIAVSAEFETLNPIVNTMMASQMVQDATVRKLVAIDPAGNLRPMLIKEIPSLANKKMTLIRQGSTTGLKAEIEFLPEAKWGDGTPVTCKDLKLSWEIGRSVNVATPNKEMYDNLQDLQIDPANPKKCSLTYKEARFNFYLNFPPPIPAHLEGPVFAANKDKAQAYERNTLYVREPTNPGLYNGPYVISELNLGSHVVMTPNPHFFGKAPAFKKVIIKFILNTSTLESNLRSGAINMISTTGLTLDQAFSFEKRIKSENLPYEVVFTPSMTYSHIDLNMENSILADIRVRKALAYSVNRNEIIKAFYQGRLKTAQSFASPSDYWFSESPEDVVIYKYDHRKAGQLLEEAGWKMGPDGYRHKNGKKLTLKLSGLADNRSQETLQVYMQDTWKKIGIDVVIKNFPARVLFPEIIRKRQFDMAFYSFVFEPNDTQKPMLHSTAIPSAANAWSGKNRSGWINKNVDSWLEQFEAEFDKQKQIALMRKVMKAYTDELPHIPLYYRTVNSVIPKGLKNYRPSGHGYSEYCEIENWTF